MYNITVIRKVILKCFKLLILFLNIKLMKCLTVYNILSFLFEVMNAWLICAVSGNVCNVVGIKGIRYSYVYTVTLGTIFVENENQRTKLCPWTCLYHHLIKHISHFQGEYYTLHFQSLFNKFECVASLKLKVHVLQFKFQHLHYTIKITLSQDISLWQQWIITKLFCIFQTID